MTINNGQLRETNNTGHKSKTNKVKKYNTAQKT